MILYYFHNMNSSSNNYKWLQNFTKSKIFKGYSTSTDIMRIQEQSLIMRAFMWVVDFIVWGDCDIISSMQSCFIHTHTNMHFNFFKTTGFVLHLRESSMTSVFAKWEHWWLSLCTVNFQFLWCWRWRCLMLSLQEISRALCNQRHMLRANMSELLSIKCVLSA